MNRGYRCYAGGRGFAGTGATFGALLSALASVEFYPEIDANGRYKTRTCDLHDVNVAL